MIFGLVNFGLDLDFFAHTDRRNMTHMSPPCIRTGELNEYISDMNISRVIDRRRMQSDVLAQMGSKRETNKTK